MASHFILTEMPDSYPVVIIHPGSINLRFGYSTSTNPVTISHCIARRRKPGVSAHSEPEGDKLFNSRETPESLAIRQNGLKGAAEVLSSRLVNRGKKRKLTSVDQIIDFNKNSHTEVFNTANCQQQWTSVKDDVQFVIGQDALLLAPDEPFNIHWPWRCGKLNIHGGIGGSVSSVVQDLQDIWSTAFEKHLNIKSSDIKHHRAVLLLPDSYKRSDVRELVDLLLNKIGFYSTFVALESVCASFEEGLQCGCVVDIGDLKTSVCCIEDGMIKKNTMVVMELGGNDITSAFYWFLKRQGLPLTAIEQSKNFGAMFVRELKETHCFLDQNVEGFKDVEMSFQIPSSSKRFTCNVRMGDERILAPMSFFFPDILGQKVGEALTISGGYKKVSDPSDVNDEDYLQQTMTKHEIAARQRRRDQTEAASNQMQEASTGDDSQLNDFDGFDQLEFNSLATRTNQTDDEKVSCNLIGLHHCIIKSIELCESEEVRQRMYNNILLVGGGAMFQGAQSHLLLLVQFQLSTQMKATPWKSYDVQVCPKESTDLSVIAWKGGRIMSCLDTSQELWLTQKLWNKHGIRALRERTPFQW